MDTELLEYIEKKLNMSLTQDEIDIKKELELLNEENLSLVNTLIDLKKAFRVAKKLIPKRYLYISIPREFIVGNFENSLAASTPSEKNLDNFHLYSVTLDEASTYLIEFYNTENEYVFSLKDINTGDLELEPKTIQLKFTVGEYIFFQNISFNKGYCFVNKMNFRSMEETPETDEIILLISEVNNADK